MINLWGIRDGKKLKSKCKGGKYYQLKTIAEGRVNAMNKWRNEKETKAELVTYYLLTEAEYRELLGKANNSASNEGANE